MLKMFPGDSGETGDDHDYVNDFWMILKWKMYLSNIYTTLILDRNDSWHTVLKSIVCIGVSTPLPQKHHPLFLVKPSTPLNLQTVQAPFLGNPPSILVFLKFPFHQLEFFSIFFYILPVTKYLLFCSFNSFKNKDLVINFIKVKNSKCINVKNVSWR